MLDRERAARLAAHRLFARFSDGDVEVDDDARVIFLDEQGTGVEGYAWVQAWHLISAEEIENSSVEETTA